MKKNTLIATTLATLGLAANGGFAQGLGATSVVADGVKSGPVLQRVPDSTSAPVPGQNPMVPPVGGSGGGGAQAPIPPAPETAPGSAADSPSATAAGPNAGAPGQIVGPQMPNFTPAQYKQAVKDTELFNAAYAGETWNVRNAIAKGAKINSSDWQYGFTPLMWASLKGHLGTVRYLLKNGAKVGTTSNGTGFMLARGRRESARVAISETQYMQPMSFLYQPNGGTSALLLAAAGGYNLTVRELLAHKANPNQLDPRGSTALMAAAFAGNIPSVRALLDAGAKINTVDTTNASPLFYAAIAGDTQMLRFLIKNGARVRPVANASDAIPAAQWRGFNDVVALLKTALKKEKPLPAQDRSAKVESNRAPAASGEGVFILN